MFIMFYVISLVLIYLITGSLYLSSAFIQLPLPPPLALLTANLISFSYYIYLCIYLFIYLTSLLEYNCFTMVCQFLLYNKVNQLYIYIYPHIASLLRLPPTLPIPPVQVVTKYRADLPVPCGCFPLAIYCTFGSVYMSMPPEVRLVILVKSQSL